MLWVCGGLNESGPHGLLHLITWSPGAGTVGEGLGGLALLEEVEVGFEVAWLRSWVRY